MHIEEGEHLGFKGVWAAIGTVRVFCVTTPFPRIIAFETRDHKAPFFVTKEHEYFGLRSWFMEPDQTDHSGLPALQPASHHAGSEDTLILRTERDPDTGLSLKMVISLCPREETLLVEHVFRNETPHKRQMAPWGILALSAENQTGFTKWGSGARRTLVLTPPTQADDPIIGHGDTLLLVDFQREPKGAFLKVGTDACCGWVASADDQMAIWAHSPVDMKEHYPEGGGTVTMFRSGGSGKDAFGEIEAVGPLRSVGFGETMALTQRVSMTAGLNGRSPEAFVADVEAGRC